MKRSKIRIGWTIVTILSFASCLYGVVAFSEGNFLVQMRLLSPVFVLVRCAILVVVVPLVLLVGYWRYTCAGKNDADKATGRSEV
jgi:hypothetical protein